MDKALYDSRSAKMLTSSVRPHLPGNLFQPSATPENLSTTLEGIKSVYPEMTLDDFYKLNSKGFRSDEFRSDHGDKQHVLFAGCSHTFGQGNILEDTWSHLLYEYLGGDTINSGYFNVGIPAATFSEVGMQILSYCYSYGVPDKVFVLLPDVYREYGRIKSLFSGSDTKSEEIVDGLNINYINNLISSILFAAIKFVEASGGSVYVTSNNIYTCDLDGHCQIDPRDALGKYFYPMDYAATESRVYAHATHKNVLHSTFALNAFDVMHTGYAFQHAWYEHFVDILEGRAYARL